MQRTKRIKKTNIFTKIIIYLILAFMLAAGICIYYSGQIPDKYYAFEGELDSLNINAFYPVTSSVIADGDDYSVDLKLLGVVPIKKVKVEVLSEKSLMAGGQTFGVKYYTDGVIVVGFSDVKTEKGEKNPAFEAGLRLNDVITKMDGEKLLSNEDFLKRIKNNANKEVCLTVKRKNLEFAVSFCPLADDKGEYRLGCWVRDSTAGIGTITYIDPVNKTFAGLGHGICDVDTGDIMPLLQGNVVAAEIYSVIKGLSGKPGELQGYFDDDVPIGNLYSNTEEGIFGSLSSDYKLSGEIYPIAFKQDITEGAAKILCSTDNGGVKAYDIEIIRVYQNSTKTTKNMVVHVTDPVLIEKTGGIVQGMSGSPIIQNGKIIGAVTHVMVGEPDKGYGIFIENMLYAS